MRGRTACGVFSWQGQVSLGGYIGADSASLFSAVSSGAAGTYLGTVTTDAGISTDLTIRAGQIVHITGGASVPAWGRGLFIVQQGGSLSLVSLALTGEGVLLCRMVAT